MNADLCWMVLKNMAIMVWYLTNSSAMEGLAATLMQRYLFQASNQELDLWHNVLSYRDGIYFWMD